MISATQVLLAILGVGGAVLLIYLMRRAAYRQLEGKGGAAKSGSAR